MTLDGTSDVDGTITISTGIVDANGAFDANSGFVTFTDAGNLNLSSTITDLGTLSDNFGTVIYDGVDQDVLTDIYNNLVMGGSSGTKTLKGLDHDPLLPVAITVNSDLTVNVDVTFDVSGSDYAVNVGGALENNGTFSAREGTVIFNGSDNQIFTPGSSSYYDITLNNAGDDKLLTIVGDLEIDHDLTLTDGTLDFDTNDPAISVAGDLAIADGAVWTKGSGTATFDGATQSLSDANTTPNDLGDALIDCDILTVATNATVTSIQISSGSITIINPSVPFTVNGVLTITGELEMADGSVVDAGGDVTVAAAGTLDMDGTSRLKMEGDLSFSGILEASDDSRIDLDGDTQQTIYGSATPIFNSLFCSSNASILNLTATINDTLDAGGEDFTISNGKTLTMETGSVTVLSGGTWTRDGTLILSSDSKVLYTTSNQNTMGNQIYGNVEHDGGLLTLGNTFTVSGIFTNTSGNFLPGARNIFADGIVWTGGSVGGTPSQKWYLGEDGIDIDGGIFIATSDTFTVAGDWDMTGSGTFIPGTGTVIFDGTAPQSITSTAGSHQPFYSVQISNTLETVSITDKFEINAGGTLTIDENAT
ncbi:uncharacterized protein METZ01_LOCUS193062, partial [marine metagenome]